MSILEALAYVLALMLVGAAVGASLVILVAKSQREEK